MAASGRTCAAAVRPHETYGSELLAHSGASSKCSHTNSCLGESRSSGAT